MVAGFIFPNFQICKSRQGKSIAA